MPVFRDDRYRLLPAPELLSEVPALLTGRAARVLAVAAASGVDDLVLGAWGCGVFGNSPADVAGACAAHLGPGGRFAGAFDRVVFAVYDRSSDRATLGAFRAVFG